VHHSKKQIEFWCFKCRELLCSLCLLKHQSHGDNIEIFSDDEIVKESNRLIGLTDSVI